MKKFTVWSIVFGIFLAAALLEWIQMQRLERNAVESQRTGTTTTRKAPRSTSGPARDDHPTRLQRGSAPMATPNDSGDVNQLWVKGTYENNLAGDILKPFDPQELARMAADPNSDTRRMADLVLRAAAEGDKSFRYLLDEPRSTEKPALNLALEAYDYSVNGNQEALDRVLAVQAEDFKQRKGGDTDAILVLAFINEWDRVQEAFNEHPMSGDGAGGDAKYAFWLKRRYLYPNNPRFPKDWEQFRAEISGR